MPEIDIKKLYRYTIIAAILIVIYILTGGSSTINNYKPESKTKETEQVSYDTSFIDDVTGGYTGAPTLISTDDKVFYIPPEYCGGSYLRNFRVLGVNQTNAKLSTEANGTQSYKGAVIVYGFQTTYKADYIAKRADYSFDRETYDYTVEKEIIDSYVGGEASEESEDTISSTDKLYSSDSTKTQFETQISSIGDMSTASGEKVASVSVSLKITPNTVIDDSEFPVATVVIERVLGDESKDATVIYCDEGSCKVKDLSVGQHNLVTNLNDDTLTVCYNDWLYVYDFDEELNSYAGEKRYFYDMTKFFDSVTFLTAMKNIGYAKGSYRGVLSHGSSYGDESRWVKNWLDGLTDVYFTPNDTNIKYMSNISGDTVSCENFEKNMNVNLSQMIKDNLMSAFYNHYKHTFSGTFSKNPDTNATNFSALTFKPTDNSSWVLTGSANYYIKEKSVLKTYKKTVNMPFTITIKNDLQLDTNFNYTVNDLILTKYDDDSDNDRYSVVLQMLITPVEESDEYEEPNFSLDAENKAAYSSNLKKKDTTAETSTESAYSESTTTSSYMENYEWDEERQSELESSENMDETEIENVISPHYLTFNIDLSQSQTEVKTTTGTETVLTVENSEKLDEFFDNYKTEYENERNESITEFKNNTAAQSGKYSEPGEWTVTWLEEFKKSFGNIHDAYIAVQAAEENVKSISSKINSLSEQLPADMFDQDFAGIDTSVEPYSEYKDIIDGIKTYRKTLAEEENALKEAEKKLTELKTSFDNNNTEKLVYAQLTWKEKKLDKADNLITYIGDYRNIIDYVDSYITEYNRITEVLPYKNYASNIIDDIIELNANIPTSTMIRCFEAQASIHSDFGTYFSTDDSDITDAFNSVSSQDGKFYYSIQGLMSLIGNSKTDTTSTEDEQQSDGTKLINDKLNSYFASHNANNIEKIDYSTWLKICETIYNTCPKAQTDVVVDTADGQDVIYTIELSDVQKILYQRLIEDYGITELYEYGSKGELLQTHTISIDMSDSTEVVVTNAEDEDEANYSNAYEVVHSLNSSLESYTKELRSDFEKLAKLAYEVTRDTGTLTDEQKALYSVPDGSPDNDATSLYNTGYMKVIEYIDDISTKLVLAENYYKVREDAGAKIEALDNKDELEIVLRNENYYESVYNRKLNQVDILKALIYERAKKSSTTDIEAVLKKYQSYTDSTTDPWLISDIPVSADLSSGLKVTSRTITTISRSLIWNTALIVPDTNNEGISNSSLIDGEYTLYQMNSNFCISILGDELKSSTQLLAYLTPIGKQSDTVQNHEQLNIEMNKRLKSCDIKQIDNVAYGSDNNTDFILFSNDTQWMLVAAKHYDVGGSQSYTDKNGALNAAFYDGKFDLEQSDDTHFLEFDHAMVTGLNQFFSYTLDNGFKPYNINLKQQSEEENSITLQSDNNPTENSSNAEEAYGFDGAFFNGWMAIKGENGNTVQKSGVVLLLGYDKESMEIESVTVESASEETTVQQVTEAVGESTTEEVQYRQIVDTDLYDAHIYVLKYGTKKTQTGSLEGGGELSSESGLSVQKIVESEFDVGDGPFAERLKHPVELLVYLRYALISIVYALAVLYAVYLSVKYAQANTDEKKQSAKEHIFRFIIVFIGTHILIVFVILAANQLGAWTKEVEVTKIVSAQNCEINTTDFL